MSSGLNPYNFTISDQSPLFQYLPFRDGPIVASWNVTYTGNSDSVWAPDTFIGTGTSSHRTTLAGASVRLDWTGTAVYLYGEASAGGYATQLDGAQANAVTSVPGLLFSQSGLSHGSHSLVLQVVQGEVMISSAIITVGMGAIGTTVQNRTIATTTVPLTTDGIVLSGGWGSQDTFSTTGRVVPRIGTTAQGSSISFPLTSASGFCVLGSVNYNHGSFIVTVTPPSDVGSPKVSQYNGSSRWIGLDTTLYLETGMDRSKNYQVKVTNNSPSQWFDMSWIVVFDTQPSSPSGTTSINSSPSGSTSSSSASSSSHPLGAGAIAGIVVGGLFALLLVFLLPAICVQRRRRRQRRQRHEERNSFPAESITPSYANHTFMREQPPSQSGVSYEWTPNNLVPGGVDVPAWNTGVLPSPTSTSASPSDAASTTYIRNSQALAPLEARSTSPNQPPSNVPSQSPQPDVTRLSYPPPTSRPLTMNSRLTDEQAELVQGLIRHNVPVNAVAGVIEGMLRTEGPSGANRMSTSDIHPDPERPPGYDFKSA